MGLADDGNPIKAAAQGAATAVLDWSSEKVAELAASLRDHRLAFLGDRETIGTVRRERRSEEAELLRRYIKDKRLREIAVLGLALRRLEKDREAADRLQALRTRIHRRHSVNGLQAAELIQRGVVSILISRALTEDHTAEDVSRALETLLNGVRRFTRFVKVTDNINSLVAEIKPKILAQNPDLFVILGHGEAMDKARRAVDSLLRALPKAFAAERFETGSDFFAFFGKREGDTIELALPV